MFGVSECFSPAICCGSIMKTVALSHNQWTSSKLGETSTSSNVNSNSAIVCQSQSSIQSSVDVEMRKSKVKSWRLERESVVKFADLSINHTMDAKTFVSNYHIWNGSYLNLGCICLIFISISNSQSSSHLDGASFNRTLEYAPNNGKIRQYQQARIIDLYAYCSCSIIRSWKIICVA